MDYNQVKKAPNTGCGSVIFENPLLKFISNEALLRILMKNRTDDQKAVIRYFCSDGGCLGGLVLPKDKDFDKILKDSVDELDIYEMALTKLCLEKDQVKEIKPIFLDGYNVNGISYDYMKIGKDDVFRCSQYQLSCVLFGADQVYFYSYIYDLANLNRTEYTSECFYRDIDSIVLTNNVGEMKIYGKGCTAALFNKFYYKTNEILTLNFTVPGNTFSCSIRPEHESSIIGMKNLIRDKKS